MHLPKTRGFYRMLMICPNDWAYGRNLVLGARHYAFTSARIEIGNGSVKPGVTLAEVVKRQHIDGIIALVQTKELESQLLQLSIPSVNVSNVLNSSRLPVVTQDDIRVGQLAAEHLVGCGCTTFAYWEQKGALFSEERIKGFCMGLEQHAPGVTCIPGGAGSFAEEEGPDLVTKMRKWIKKLPAQTGIFTVLDPFALHLIQAAREEERQIPGNLAVLGVGDDEFWVDF